MTTRRKNGPMARSHPSYVGLGTPLCEASDSCASFELNLSGPVFFPHPCAKTPTRAETPIRATTPILAVLLHGTDHHRRQNCTLRLQNISLGS